MPAMDTTRARVEAEVGLSFLSLAPHIDSSFVLYPTRKRRGIWGEAVSNRDLDNGRCSSTVVLVSCRSGRVS